MSLIRFIPPLLAVTLVLGACDAADRPGSDDPSADGRAAAEGTADAAGQGLATDSIEALAPSPGFLTPINRSGVRGTATATRGDDGVVVEVEVDSLEAGGRYTAHVHEGRCADGGPIRLPLGRIMADDAGSGSLRMRVEPDRLPADGELFVQLHAADDRPVACANLMTGEPAS